MKRLLACLLLCLLLCGCVVVVPEAPAADVPSDSTGLTVHYLDVGQADCILLQCDGENMLIDGGNVEDSDLVIAYLLEQNVTELEYVVNTHAHEDHVGGLPAVLAVMETHNVWCPVKQYGSQCFDDFVKYADQQYLELVCPEPGTQVSLGSAAVTVLGPVKDNYDTNNSSIVLRVDYGNTGFLFTGDAETQAEEDILEAGFDVSATVLKVGHHGSDTSSSYRWLREVDASYAVIQVGTDNSYDHPHEIVMSRLRDSDTEVLRTDLQGHIVCRSDGETVTFDTERAAAVTNPTTPVERFIGNKSSEKFHLESCSGLPKEENRIVFDSYSDAVAAGYVPCSRCIG